MVYYMEEFRKRGIPVEFSGTLELKDYRILNYFCRLYQYLASKKDKKAKEGALPVLLRANAMAGAEIIGQERLELLSERTKGLDGYALARYLASHPEYVMKWDVTLEQEEMYAAQVLLWQMVETVIGTTRGTAVELADAFKEYVSKALERELPLEEKQNAVRFMNLHKAKGLEGRITIITNRRMNGPTDNEEFTTSVPDDQGMFRYYGSLLRKNEYINLWDGLHGYESYPQIQSLAQKEEEAERVRLEYVAATRAKEALIVMSAYNCIAPTPMAAYSIPKENAIEVFLFGALLSGPGAAGAGAGQMPSGNGTTQAAGGTQSQTTAQPSVYQPKQQLVPEELKKAAYVTFSPSQLENHSAKTEDSASDRHVEIAKNSSTDPEDLEEEIQILELEEMKVAELNTLEEQSTEKRPKGKVFGTVMHRSYELLVNACWEDKSLLENASALENVVSSSVCQAIMEQADDLEREGKWLYFKGEHSEENYLEIVRDYLVPVLRKYALEGMLKEFLQDALEVYTELSFSYYIRQEQDEEMFQALQKYLEQKKIQVEAGKPVWINGTADLIIRKKDDRVLIVDYKSDSIGERTLPGFEEVLKERYAGQMLLYRYSMGRLFQVKQEKISVKLQHLYKTK